MKLNALLVFITIALTACNTTKDNVNSSETNIKGTWQLKNSYIITKGDTVNTSPPKDIEMLKIINDTHFAFLKHDLNKGKDKQANFDAGAGTYKLVGDKYTENLDYCNYREWEGHTFDFTLKFKGDTLIQKGIEKIDSLNINREIIEIYTRKGK